MVFGLSNLINAATSVNLGSADNFAVLAGSGITDTTPSVITGDVGLSPTTGAAIGLTAGEVTGTIYAVDAAGPAGGAGNNPALVGGAKTALTTAYNDAVAQAADSQVGDLGGQTLVAGVYEDNNAPDSMAITAGTKILTLDGQNNPNAVFIFKSGSTLVTAAGSEVRLMNGAQACNVFWQVTSSVTLGVGSIFIGNILADDSITDNGGSTVQGRLLASTGAVTLNNTTVTKAGCAPALHLRKLVTLDNGGTALITNWNLTATGTGGSPTNLTGATPVDSGSTFEADTYTLAESGGPAGYTASTYSCVKNGGGAVVSNTITLVAGDTATCTITNNDQAPSLTLNKIAINDDTGIAVEADWTVTATGPTSISGPGAAGSADVVSGPTFSAGTYTLSESVGPAGYAASSWSCVKNGGVPAIGASIILGLNDTATCTITNDDTLPGALPATINVVKTVINDNGQSKIVSDFPLFVNGSLVISGATNVFAAPAAYVITETTDSHYTQTFSGDCDATGHLNLAAGQDKVCIITNNDIAPVVVPPSGGGGGGGGFSAPVPVPPLIDVVKVPSPLALPGGAGPVTYTYTLRNIGTVPVINITMVGDSCAPIILVSGDSNSNGILEVNETWVHTCSTTLMATHTNTVVATGWANGLTTTDIASATVVVGAPIVPPLIHVIKVPNPVTLPVGGGMVTYTKTITNPGAVPLSNVRLTDDKCSPVNYVSGDTNSDTKLDLTETWIYTCRTNLTHTTTNTVIAAGEANGLTARDFAIATVVVAMAIPISAIPGLPNAGVAPSQSFFGWLVLVVAMISILFFVYRFQKKYELPH